MEYFEKKVKVGKADECWLWQGALKDNRERANYGAWRKNLPGHHGQVLRSHRATYILFKGAIPDGMQVLHTCDVSLCCNPAHLYAGTNADNVRDRDERGLFVNWKYLPKYAEHPRVKKQAKRV